MQEGRHPLCCCAAGGVWYKGTVVDLKQAQPGKDAPPEEKERYDPWESLVVHWDRGGWPGQRQVCAGAAGQQFEQAFHVQLEVAAG